MRIGAESRSAAQLVPEVAQLLFGQAPLQERARVDARRSVSLEINQVAGPIAVAAVKEMVEADFDERGEEA